jgi:hypothetical protein
MKVRKKPVEVEAIQFEDSKEGIAEALRFLGSQLTGLLPNPTKIAIHTLEGTMIAEPGDWIIKGVKGEFYPCKPDIFQATYEVIE